MIRPVPKPQPKPKAPPKRLERSRMKRKRSRRVENKTDVEKQYLEWLHQQDCAALMLAYQCNGYTVSHYCYAGRYASFEPVQPAHIRGMTGTGPKEPDTTCIPLCREA